jgi:hypothetical protein
MLATPSSTTTTKLEYFDMNASKRVRQLRLFGPGMQSRYQARVHGLEGAICTSGFGNRASRALSQSVLAKGRI